MRRYKYVGPSDIMERSRRRDDCIRVNHPSDVLSTIEGIWVATFIIDTDEQLWVADRRSEHVACADGKDVLAAGEITLERTNEGLIATQISNQSTGYCPEPSSWSTVQRVLERVGIPHPSRFTHAFEFRRCDKCQTTNLIKDSVFECAVCGAEISRVWNYAK